MMRGIIAVVERSILLIFVYSLLVFIKEVLVYQCLELPLIWNTISLEQQTLININLGLMDLKIIFTMIGLLMFLHWFIEKEAKEILK